MVPSLPTEGEASTWLSGSIQSILIANQSTTEIGQNGPDATSTLCVLYNTEIHYEHYSSILGIVK